MEQVTKDGYQAELRIGSAVYPVLFFTGDEAVKAPYCFTIGLDASFCDLDDSVLGEPCALRIYQLPPDFSSNWSFLRHIPGLITETAIKPLPSGLMGLMLTLKPKLSTLSLWQRPRVYVKQSVHNVAERLLRYHGYLPGEFCFLRDNRREPRYFPHWVQAQDECDFDFFHRLLAHEGMNYFWQDSAGGDERLTIAENAWFHPVDDSATLMLVDDSGLRQAECATLSNLQEIAEPLDYSVLYCNSDPRDIGVVREAQTGKGWAQVVVSGCNAQSMTHLKHLSNIHYEALTMRTLTYKAHSTNPHLRSGFGISIAKTPFWPKESMFNLLHIKHHFDAGCYRNELTFIPKERPIRPMPTKRQAGQLVHTAFIHSDDDLPYLDQTGHYAFYTHAHDGDATPSLQAARRLTPYGGDAAQWAMGMHFPQHRQTEVLVMYLHNDLNQPVLQNSPPNDAQVAPVVRDNSWCTLLKTAWGQYLQFSDRKNCETVSLVNAQQNQGLYLKGGLKANEASLRATRGTLALHAGKNLHFDSAANITARARGNMDFCAKYNMSFKAYSVHHQATDVKTTAHHVDIKAGMRLEAQAQDISLQSDGDISLVASDDVLQVDLPNGDIIIKAQHVTLQADKTLDISVPGNLLRLEKDHITLQGTSVALQSASLNLSCPVEEAPAPLAVIAPALDAPEPCEPPFYADEAAKVIHPPAWDKRLYHHEETAWVDVSIEGFNGDEAGMITVLRYHHTQSQGFLSDPPPAHALAVGKPVFSHRFVLGDEALYVTEKATGDHPGTARLRLPYPLTSLRQIPDKVRHDPYYARVEITGVKSVYTSAMLLLGTANVWILHDKGLPYNDPDGILTLKRALPDSIKVLKESPPLKAYQYYANPLQLKNLPAGGRNVVRLRDKGQMRELLNADYQRPQSRQALEIDLKSTNETHLVRLMPPMIVNLRNARLDQDQVIFDPPEPDARMQLSAEEVAYIEANGNNITLFIHGFNVEHGDFSPHWGFDENHSATDDAGMSHTIRPPAFSKDEASATIYRDFAFFARQFPNVSHHYLKKEFNKACNNNLNGTGMHAWVTHLEHHLNQAAGFNGEDYRLFSRGLFISWPGVPEHAWDYMQAVRESVRLGPVVAELIQTLHSQISDLKLHVIAHSQGNGILLHALNKLPKDAVEHAIFWQAAIPNNALSDYGLYSPNPPDMDALSQKQAHNPWFCPHAHLAAKRITVLYSQNDNILGRLLHAREQPKGVTLRDVWPCKPMLEMLPALLVQALELNSIYRIAAWFGIPASELFQTDCMEAAWEEWTASHPVFYHQKQPMHCQKTLQEQAQLLGRHNLLPLAIDFTRQLSDGVEEVHQLLCERFEYLSVSEKAIGIASMVFAARLAPGLIGSLIQILLKLLKKSKHKRLDRPILHQLIFSAVARYLTRYEVLIQNISAFIQTKLLTDGTHVPPAMGYEGPDETDRFLKQLRDQGKLNAENTTEWIWHHSHMFEGNEKIMKNVYKKFIINRKSGIKAFGRYDIKN